jgi:hypothetical protein
VIEPGNSTPPQHGYKVTPFSTRVVPRAPGEATRYVSAGFTASVHWPTFEQVLEVPVAIWSAFLRLLTYQR